MTQPIDIVNEYRALTGKQVAFVRNELSAMRYIRWCEKYHVDPLRFMKARIGLAVEGERPVPAISALASQGLLKEDAWAEILDRVEGREQDAVFAVSEMEKSHERYIEILLANTPAQEGFKKSNREVPDVCRAEREFSGGYHPMSTCCALCPVAGVCAEQLNRDHGFDVVTLRMQRGYIGYVRVT